MFTHEPFSSSNFLKIHASLDDRRRGAALRHVARLRHISEDAPYDAEYGNSTNPPAFVLFQILPDEPVTPLPLLDHIEELHVVFAEHFTGVAHTRWNQDGVTLQGERASVKDALTVFADGGIELFTRRPFYEMRETWHASLPLMIKRLTGTANAAKSVAETFGCRPGEFFLDLSLVGVRPISLVKRDGHVFPASGSFDRDHVHITSTLTANTSEEDSQFAVFLDQVCQAGGLAGWPERD